MSEWWTYRLSDFLLFSPRTYYRLFELYNAEVWPLQLAGLGIGLLLLACTTLWRGRTGARRAAFVLLAACWCWIAWAFHWRQFASINWAAAWYAGAFVLQGVLLLVATLAPSATPPAVAGGWRRGLGLGILIFAVLVWPMLGIGLGRPALQAEVIGLAPDPSALATLGGLLLMQPMRSAVYRSRDVVRMVLWWLLWPVPFAWCLVSGATLWVMQSPEALLLPIAALLAGFAAFGPRAEPGRRSD